MNKYCVLGHPILHSKSPLLFKEISKIFDLDLDYEKVDCKSENLEFILKTLKGLKDREANVTLPLKESVLKYVDRLSLDAAAIGAVNVLSIKNGTVNGHNTDIIGIKYTLESQGLKLKNKTALVFGAGGAAKAVCYSLGKMGCGEVIIKSRTASKGKTLCSRMGRLFPKTKFTQAKNQEYNVQLVINTTPLGLATHKYSSLLSPVTSEYAFDLLYHEELTGFLKEAGAKGMKTFNGLDMFVAQAIASLEIWEKKLNRTEKEELHKKLVKYLKRIKK